MCAHCLALSHWLLPLSFWASEAVPFQPWYIFPTYHYNNSPLPLLVLHKPWCMMPRITALSSQTLKSSPPNWSSHPIARSWWGPTLEHLTHTESTTIKLSSALDHLLHVCLYQFVPNPFYCMLLTLSPLHYSNTPTLPAHIPLCWSPWPTWACWQPQTSLWLSHLLHSLHGRLTSVHTGLADALCGPKPTPSAVLELACKQSF